MRWATNLYVGGEAKAYKNQIIRKIKKHKFQLEVYVLCVTKTEKSILNIYPAHILNQKFYRDFPMFIVGLAVGYEEALAVCEKMVLDCFNETGHFDIEKFMEEK